MAATWATCRTSPLRADPSVTSLSVAGSITTSPRATASRTVSRLPPTSTIRARPCRSRWVSSRPAFRGRRGARAPARAPPAADFPRRSVDTLLVPAPVGLPQFVLHDLAGPGLGKALPKLDRARQLEPRQVPPAVAHDLFGGRPLPRLEDDERFGGLPPPLVRHRDHGALEDRGMGGDDLLDLDGGDVLPAADDDVFLAVDDRHVALRIDNRHIPGVEPAVADGLSGPFGVPVIALHHDVAPRHDLAHGRPVRRHLAPLAVDHPHVDPDDLESGRGAAPQVVVGGPAEVGLGERFREKRRGLGQPVADDAQAPQLLLHPPDP